MTQEGEKKKPKLLVRILLYIHFKIIFVHKKQTCFEFFLTFTLKSFSQCFFHNSSVSIGYVALLSIFNSSCAEKLFNIFPCISCGSKDTSSKSGLPSTIPMRFSQSSNQNPLFCSENSHLSESKGISETYDCDSLVRKIVQFRSKEELFSFSFET